MQDTDTVIGVFSIVAQQLLDFSHAADPNDTLDREVGLVSELSGEIVRAQLERRNQRVLDEVLRPLVQKCALEFHE